MKPFEAPEVVEKTADEIETIIAAIRSSNLSEPTQAFVIKCIQLACWVPHLLQKKNISLSRLREMLFGKGYHGKTKKNKGGGGSGSSGSSDEPAAAGEDSGNSGESSAKSDEQAQAKEEKSSKHSGGRNAHTVYQDFDEHWLRIGEYDAGDKCPEQCGGRLYALPCGVVVRIVGQNIAKPVKYYVEKLRCNVCHYAVNAPLPAHLGKEKYTPQFKAQLAMHKFYLGVPYYRLERYQRLMGCPLPDSTQWDILERLAGDCYGVFHCLERLAANGKLIHNDDTWLKILEVIAELKQADNPKRTGMYTTCIMGTHEGHPIVLYLNGRLHSGENVDNLLKLRDKERPVCLQMSDALAANTPANIATLVCYCLSHGFRKFEALKDFFPKACLSVMHQLSQVFEFDAKTKGMDDKTRLAYHQKHSGPILHALYTEIEQWLAHQHTEPNGDLAAALNYLKKHWVRLTRFLSVPGAPIDNNVVERALKLAIRVRKNSLFYRSIYSASLSGMLTSLIYTCQLSEINPVDYLTALQECPEAVRECPERWLPWNYRASLGVLKPADERDAKVMAVPLTRDSPVAIEPAEPRPSG